MQTPKRPGSLDVPQRKSPATTPRSTARKLKTPGSVPDPVSSPKSPAKTPGAARKLKTPGSVSGRVSSPNSANKTPKSQSLKTSERRSPRSPANEIPKKPSGRISGVESQLVQLEEELKKAKEQVITSESLKKQAGEESEEIKMQATEINALEDSKTNELHELSQEQDTTWQSKLEAMKNQHTMDSAALASAMDEIQKLKVQLVEKESESEVVQATKHAEESTMENLRMELSETRSFVDKLRAELRDSKESENEAQNILNETREQLDTTNVALETLRLDKISVSEAYDSVLMKLEQSKAEVKSLEGLLENPQENDEMVRLKEELNISSVEINELNSAMEAAERRYHEEYIQSTLQIQSAYEQVEATKAKFSRRETELEEELKKTEAETHELKELKDKLMDNEIKLQEVVEENKKLNLKTEAETHELKELKDKLMDNEIKLQEVVEENKKLHLKIQEQEEQEEPEIAIEVNELEMALAEVKGILMDKEMELQSVTAQNDSLKKEIGEIEIEKDKVVDEALMKLEKMTEEAEKGRMRAERAVEQLGAVQETNTELETELRKLKVQSDQWRKAAEAAAAMLTGGKTGKLVERTGSLESPLTRNMSSYLDDADGGDDDGDMRKKKNVNVLKKIGVLLRKGQK